MSTRTEAIFKGYIDDDLEGQPAHPPVVSQGPANDEPPRKKSRSERSAGTIPRQFTATRPLGETGLVAATKRPHREPVKLTVQQEVNRRTLYERICALSLAERGKHPRYTTFDEEPEFAIGLHRMITSYTITNRPATMPLYIPLSTGQVVDNLYEYYDRFFPKQQVSSEETRERHEFQDPWIDLAKQRASTEPEIENTFVVASAFAENKHLYPTRAAAALIVAYARALQP